jgi:hypothetical protein
MRETARRSACGSKRSFTIDQKPLATRPVTADTCRYSAMATMRGDAANAACSTMNPSALTSSRGGRIEPGLWRRNARVASSASNAESAAPAIIVLGSSVDGK